MKLCENATFKTIFFLDKMVAYIRLLLYLDGTSSTTAMHVASLCVVGQHGAALAEHEARDVGGELDLVVDEVVLDLLPVDEVPEGGQVLEAVRTQPPVGHGRLVEDEVRVSGQLQEAGDEAVGVEVL